MGGLKKVTLKMKIRIVIGECGCSLSESRMTRIVRIARILVIVYCGIFSPSGAASV